MTGRIGCCVPGCRRTYHNREGFAAWICSPHWQMTDKLERKIYARMRRRKKRGIGSAEARHRIWERLRKQAIERAMGI